MPNVTYRYAVVTGDEVFSPYSDLASVDGTFLPSFTGVISLTGLTPGENYTFVAYGVDPLGNDGPLISTSWSTYVVRARLNFGASGHDTSHVCHGLTRSVTLVDSMSACRVLLLYDRAPCPSLSDVVIANLNAAEVLASYGQVAVSWAPVALGVTVSG